MKRYFIILACVSIVVAAYGNIKKEDSVVATVNGKPILKSTLDQNYKQNLLVISSKEVTKEKVLDDLINRELGLQRAKKNQLEQDPTVKDKMEDVLYHAQVSKDLEVQFNKISVTDDEVKSYYKDFPEYRTAHILFRTRVEATEDEENAALSKALEVRRKIQSDPNLFPELANQYSQIVAAANGGDVGFQPAVSMAPEYFKAIKDKPIGYITTPVGTQFGYHIIKIIAVKKFEDIDLPMYKKIVSDMKRDKIIVNYFKQLRDNAKIVVEKKLLD